MRNVEPGFHPVPHSAFPIHVVCPRCGEGMGEEESREEGVMMARKHEETPRAQPRTGVGTPGPGAQAGGAELGGDTGDVGTPRSNVSGSPGGSGGTAHFPPRSRTGDRPGTPAEGTAGARRRREAA